ncbi:MAG: hypothetical protein ACP5N2_01510 [Candidatus Nanoarchaeia archaeon]
MDLFSFFRKRKNVLSVDCREEFFALTKKLFDKDNFISERFEEEYKRINSISKEELVELSDQIGLLIRMDSSLIFLIKEMQRKDILDLRSDNLKKDYKRILKLLSEIKQGYLKTSKDISKLLYSNKSNLSSKNDQSLTHILAREDDIKSILGHIIQIELNEKKSINKLQKEMQNIIEVDNSRLKDLDFTFGKYRIYLEKITENTYGMATHRMVVLYSNLEVAIARVIYGNKTIEAASTQTNIPFNAYLENAINILLSEKIIDVWISDISRSPSAEKMYLRLGGKFKVKNKQCRYFVSRKN